MKRGDWHLLPVLVVGPRRQLSQQSLHPPRSHTGTGTCGASPRTHLPTNAWRGTGTCCLSSSLDRGVSYLNNPCIRRGPTPGQAPAAPVPACTCQRTHEAGGLAPAACPRRWTAASAISTILASAALPHRDRHLRRQSPNASANERMKWGDWHLLPVLVVGPRRQLSQQSLPPPRSHTGTGTCGASPRMHLPTNLWNGGTGTCCLSSSLDRGVSYLNNPGIRRGPTPGQALAAPVPECTCQRTYEMGGLALAACPRRWTAASAISTILASAALPPRDRHLRRQSPRASANEGMKRGDWHLLPVLVVGPRRQLSQQSLHPPRSHTGTGTCGASPRMHWPTKVW